MSNRHQFHHRQTRHQIIHRSPLMNTFDPSPFSHSVHIFSFLLSRECSSATGLLSLFCRRTDLAASNIRRQKTYSTPSLLCFASHFGLSVPLVCPSCLISTQHATSQPRSTCGKRNTASQVVSTCGHTQHLRRCLRVHLNSTSLLYSLFKGVHLAGSTLLLFLGAL